MCRDAEVIAVANFVGVLKQFVLPPDAIQEYMRQV